MYYLVHFQKHFLTQTLIYVCCVYPLVFVSNQCTKFTITRRLLNVNVVLHGNWVLGKDFPNPLFHIKPLIPIIQLVKLLVHEYGRIHLLQLHYNEDQSADTDCYFHCKSQPHWSLCTQVSLLCTKTE